MNNVTTKKGFGAAGILVIVGIIIIAGGFLYSGALKQESDLAEDSPEVVKDDGVMPEENGEAMSVPEIGLEDEMIVLEEESGSAVVVFDVSGVNFAFSEKEIRVKKGDRVRINFTSTDGFHDWVVDEFNASTDRISAGGSASVEFVADQVGTFEYYCSVGNHRGMGMVGNLIVE